MIVINDKKYKGYRALAVFAVSLLAGCGASSSGENGSSSQAGDVSAPAVGGLTVSPGDGQNTLT